MAILQMTEQLPVKDDVLTIQQVAQMTGLSAHTLRYYERADLMMPHVGRYDANGYRFYTRQHVAWIEFIKRLRSTGMPIRDIQRYTELFRLGEQTLPERILLLKEHRSRVEEHLNEVEHYLSAITTKIAHYEQQDAQNQLVFCGEGSISRDDE